MPLLLAHNILSTQAENIRNILEKQGIGLVVEQAERQLNQKLLFHQLGLLRNGYFGRVLLPASWLTSDWLLSLSSFMEQGGFVGVC